MNKLARKIERLEKELIYLENCVREKKQEIKKTKKIAQLTPDADKRKFLK